MSPHTTEYRREEARDIPVYKKTDILVAGSRSTTLALKQGVSPAQVDIPTLRKTLED